MPYFAAVVPLGSQAAAAYPQLSQLVSATVRAGLNGTLDGKPHITVFAPNDQAFQKVTVSQLSSLLGNQGELKKVLNYHIVDQQITPDELSKGSFTTVEGSELTTSGSGTSFKVNDKANIVCGNIKAATPPSTSSTKFCSPRPDSELPFATRSGRQQPGSRDVLLFKKQQAEHDGCPQRQTDAEEPSRQEAVGSQVPAADRHGVRVGDGSRPNSGSTCRHRLHQGLWTFWSHRGVLQQPGLPVDFIDEQYRTLDRVAPAEEFHGDAVWMNGTRRALMDAATGELRDRPAPGSLVSPDGHHYIMQSLSRMTVEGTGSPRLRRSAQRGRMAAGRWTRAVGARSPCLRCC
ncbi:fasciclin domain-containing protein [Streptomyces naganishii]|uniref:FAS1 domain-containing protein n=1 Tax=Streptomyces naganishii JCM 4654 TaxID=1306179 RepID=A0A918Y5R5_9ACTN|nr:fasciclin domain-containing protein [Streptomyces naganishii]GHD91876.1 hypothetical protein GCM10010508_42380 [Streptomyces naganishii JCM 4654]